jgi:crotonobetainyl-CoA:carnitine CoA-transferase CaiB-like acyl-CoA transferase
MTKIMDGVRVLEVAMYMYVPAAGAVLADWGAEVIKVENALTPDPMRGTAAWGLPASIDGVSYLWEVTNRGKRGIAVDIHAPEGREIILRLAEESDVFLTNFLPTARRKLGIDVDDVMARNPRIVYARGSGQGARGPEADKGGFDGISYWARSGAAASVTPKDASRALAMPGPGFGDIQSGVFLAGGIAAALFARERTGQGVVVDGSLLAGGMWAMQPTIAASLLTGQATVPHQAHAEAQNPVVNGYRTGDGRTIVLGMLQADRYWSGFCTSVGRPEWIDDERLATAAQRHDNRQLCVALLDELFGARTLAEWKETLARQEGPWDVVQMPSELPQDAQARANGYAQQIPYGPDRSVTVVTAPIQFDEQVVVAPTRAPHHGADTDEVLGGLGIGAEEIVELRARGVVG